MAMRPDTDTDSAAAVPDWLLRFVAVERLAGRTGEQIHARCALTFLRAGFGAEHERAMMRTIRRAIEQTRPAHEQPIYEAS